LAQSTLSLQDPGKSPNRVLDPPTPIKTMEVCRGGPNRLVATAKGVSMLEALVLLTGIITGAEAPPSDTSGLAERVRQLLRQLDSPQLSQRDAAEEELLKLGPQVLELLPQRIDPGKAEVAQRVGRIRLKLERARAASGMEPSRVTLRSAMTLEKILAALEQQTGNKISAARLGAASPLMAKQIDVDFPQAPFWQALDDLLDRAGLSVYPFGEQGAIELAARPARAQSAGSGRVSYAGPFRFEAVSLLAQRDLRLPDSESLKLEMDVFWEPRLAPITLKQHLADVRATDDQGRSIAVQSPEAALEIAVGRGPIAKRFTLPMALPPREARKLARLRGALRALVPGPLETFRFDALGRAKPAPKRTASVVVTLESAAKTGEVAEVRVLVRFDRADEALASHRTWIFNNPAFLEDRDGKAVTPDSASPTRQTDNEVGIAYQFRIAQPLDSYAMVYQTPVTIFFARLEYEFRDLPLP